MPKFLAFLRHSINTVKGSFFKKSIFGLARGENKTRIVRTFISLSKFLFLVSYILLWRQLGPSKTEPNCYHTFGLIWFDLLATVHGSKNSKQN